MRERLKNRAGPLTTADLMEPAGDGLKVAYQVRRQPPRPFLDQLRKIHHFLGLRIPDLFRVAPEPTARRPPGRPTRAVTPCPVSTSRPPSRYTPIAHHLLIT
jgi:hypothetical protein